MKKKIKTPPPEEVAKLLAEYIARNEYSFGPEPKQSDVLRDFFVDPLPEAVEAANAYEAWRVLARQADAAEAKYEAARDRYYALAYGDNK